MAQTAADLTTVEQRLEAEFLASVPSTATVQSYQSSLLADGSWADVPYTNTAQTNWAPMTHLDRLGLMCRAYAHPSGSLHQNATLLADILKAFDCWISKNPQSTNWWYNQIAVPQELGESMVLIKEQLSTARLNSGLSVLQRAYIARSTNSGTNTGQNRVDRAIAGIQRGIVAGSVPITQDAFLAISDTILVTTAEGIQKDGSFHQHGAQLYNQGYGSLFISNTLKWAAKAADTGFAFSEGQRRILTDYLLDGTRWMNRGQAIDYTASGRGLSRKSQSANGAGLGSLATTSMAVLPGYRSAELEALRSAINAANTSGAADPALAFSGGKHFWRGDYTAWHRPQGYAAVKISSTRTLQPESGNGEGLKNYHLGDGVNLILRTGNEYDDIMPVWNWRKLPGTTTEQGTYSLKPTADWGVAGTSTYAGGISDGTYAGTAFRYNRRNVAAKKAWFFFDDAFVALGAEIDAPAATAQVETTLNQCLLNGAVTYNTGGSPQTLPNGTTTLAGVQWVHHDGTGYFFNEVPSSASIQAAAQTGTWAVDQHRLRYYQREQECLRAVDPAWHGFLERQLCLHRGTGLDRRTNGRLDKSDGGAPQRCDGASGARCFRECHPSSLPCRGQRGHGRGCKPRRGFRLHGHAAPGGRWTAGSRLKSGGEDDDGPGAVHRHQLGLLDRWLWQRQRVDWLAGRGSRGIDRGAAPVERWRGESHRELLGHGRRHLAGCELQCSARARREHDTGGRRHDLDA